MTPNVYIHEVLANTLVAGQLPDTAPDAGKLGDPSYGGITQLFRSCSQAGRIDAGTRGLTLIAIGAELPGIASFTLNVRDRNTLVGGANVLNLKVLDSAVPKFVEQVNDVTSFLYNLEGGVLIPPGHSLEFTANAQTNDVGRIYFIIGPAFSGGSGYVSINKNKV